MSREDRPNRDDALVQGLRDALEVEPVPPEVAAAAKAAFTWRTIDAELAALAYDSLDDVALVAVRGGEGPRALSFEAGEAVIELEVESTGSVHRLEGQVAPTQVERLELQRVDADEAVALPVDDFGRFRADRLAAGWFRLRCHFLAEAGGATLMTEWVLI